MFIHTETSATRPIEPRNFAGGHFQFLAQRRSTGCDLPISIQTELAWRNETDYTYSSSARLTPFDFEPPDYVLINTLKPPTQLRTEFLAKAEEETLMAIDQVGSASVSLNDKVAIDIPRHYLASVSEQAELDLLQNYRVYKAAIEEVVEEQKTTAYEEYTVDYNDFVSELDWDPRYYGNMAMMMELLTPSGVP